MATDTATESRWRIVTASELLGSSKHGAPRGVLWAKLQRMEASLRLIQERVGASSEDRAFIGSLLDRLEMARASITKRAKDGALQPRIFVNSTFFWSILHEVSADALLVMPLDMLAAEAPEVLQQFKRNIVESGATESWLGKDGTSGPLWVALKDVETLARKPGPLGPEEEAKLRHARHVLRGVRREVDQHTDLSFQRLNLTLLIRGSSGILLMLLFLLAFLFNRAVWLSPLDEGTLWSSTARLLSLVMLGAGGAIVANMTSEIPALVTNGPRWRQFIFYLFVRPALGGFAAFLFYLLAQSGLLFSIEEPSRQGPEELPPAIRIVLGSPEAVSFAFALISIAAGYSAERILGSTIDRVLKRLLSTAEKTVASPREPQPAADPPPKAAEHTP